MCSTVYRKLSGGDVVGRLAFYFQLCHLRLQNDVVLIYKDCHAEQNMQV